MQDILQQLSFNNTQIQTPFGTKLIVPAASYGGTYDEIESIIQNTFKPIICDLSQELEKQIIQYSEQSILNSLKANDLKLIVGGNNLTEAYQAIQVTEGTQVFIQETVSLHSFVGWSTYCTKIDKMGSNIEKFKIQIQENRQKQIILSFKFSENFNNYKQYVQIMKEDRNKKVMCVMEFENCDQLNVQQLSFIDYFIFTTQNMVGGQESLCLILAREQQINYQFKSKYLLGLYRSALVLEFQQSQFFDQKNNNKQQIGNQFLTSIQKSNNNLKQIAAAQIEITKIDNEFAVNITQSKKGGAQQNGDGKEYMNSNHIQKVLWEIFGIQTISVNKCKTKQGLQIFFTQKEFNDLQSKIEFSEQKSEHLKISLFFQMSPTEIQYIVSALERIATYQSEIYILYRTRTNQYNQIEMYRQYPEKNQFSLQNFKNQKTNKIKQSQRDDILLKQLQSSREYFQNPKDYIKISQDSIDESQSSNNSRKYLSGDESVMQQLMNKQQQKNSKQKLSSLESSLVNKNNSALLPQNKQALPSQIFSNNMYSLQRRQQNLKLIFEFYGEKVGEKDDKSDNYLITVSQIWKFVQDFKFTELVPISDINEYVRQVAFCIRGVTFSEFQQVLEKIAKKIHVKNDNLPTQYDKTEAFYLNEIGIDLKDNFKQILTQKQNEREIAQNRSHIEKMAEEHNKHNNQLIKKAQPQEAIKGYYQMHQNQSEEIKRLNHNVDWDSIEKQTATEFTKGIGEKNFNPSDLVDLNDQDLYLMSYDISNDLKIKKKKQQDLNKQILDYGNYKEIQRHHSQKLKTEIDKKIYPETQKNRIKEVEAKEIQREKNLLEFLNQPTQNRKKI